jgi:uncharacterized membrane protein YfcA
VQIAFTGALWPWSPALLALAVVIALGAGVVRGFSGFGFSALVVAGLTPFVPPGPVVAGTLVLEAIASASLIRTVTGDVDRLWLKPLLIGNAVFVPIGLAALSWVPVEQLRLIVAGGLLCGAAALRLVDGHHFRKSATLSGVTGAASGFLNGFAASGGVIAAMLMIATHLPSNKVRATMISFLLYVSLYALLWSFALTVMPGSKPSRLLGPDTLRWIMLLWPTMFVGMRFGARAFGTTPSDGQKRLVLNLLIVVSALGLFTAIAAR